jgi:ABC-type antimicrobial peptide transport system permease subunit
MKNLIEYRISFVSIISALIGLIFGILIIYYAYSFHQTVSKNMYKDCKICSAFQKDCPYTDKELNEQEYGNGPCADMSYYEMLWKLSLYAVFFGIGFVGIAISIFASIGITIWKSQS